jgi:hypothetical protein
MIISKKGAPHAERLSSGPAGHFALYKQLEQSHINNTNEE